MSAAPVVSRRAADAVNALREEHGRMFERMDERLSAVEKGFVGTPTEPGLVGKFEAMKVDQGHKFDNITGLLKINNWLTGLVIVILIAAGLRVLVG